MMKRTISTYLVALAVLAGAAGSLTVATSPVTAPQAQAFGLGDITKAAKKVGGTVKSGAKTVGGAAKKVGSTVKKGAVKVKNGIKEVGNGFDVRVPGTKNWYLSSKGAWARGNGRFKKLGGAIKKGVKWAGRTAQKSKIVKGIVDDAKTVGGAIKKGAVKAGGGIKKGGKWVGKTAGKSHLVRGAIRDAKAIGRRIKNVAKKLEATATLPPKTGKITRASRSPRPAAMPMIARDKSVRRRPLSGSKKDVDGRRLSMQKSAKRLQSNDRRRFDNRTANRRDLGGRQAENRNLNARRTDRRKTRRNGRRR